MVQWLRILLAVQGTWIQSLVREDFFHIPRSNAAHALQLLKPWSLRSTAKASTVGSPQVESSPTPTIRESLLTCSHEDPTQKKKKKIKRKTAQPLTTGQSEKGQPVWCGCTKYSHFLVVSWWCFLSLFLGLMNSATVSALCGGPRQSHGQISHRGPCLHHRKRSV